MPKKQRVASQTTVAFQSGRLLEASARRCRCSYLDNETRVEVKVNRHKRALRLGCRVLVTGCATARACTQLIGYCSGAIHDMCSVLQSICIQHTAWLAGHRGGNRALLASSDTQRGRLIADKSTLLTFQRASCADAGARLRAPCAILDGGIVGQCSRQPCGLLEWYTIPYIL